MTARDLAKQICDIAIASTVGTIAWNFLMLVYVRRAMGIDASAMALAPRRA